MKKFLMAVAALACVGGVAFAGPNVGGTITPHDANLAYTPDITDFCGLGLPLTSCPDGVDAMIDGSDQWVWKVYALFPDQGQPRLKGITFGVYYPGDDLVISGYGNCAGDPNNGALELEGPGWPGPSTGTSLVFENTHLERIVECYWFGGYNYTGAAFEFALGPHADPNLGGMFADDDVPSNLDPIAGFGTLGFGMPGTPACPDIIVDPTGACCRDEICTVTTELDCQGEWQGQDVPCDPNPCLFPTGACCVREECFILNERDCLAQEGTYLGDDTVCDPNPCEFSGACCVGQDCLVLTETECMAQDGTYLGDNLPCDPNPCLNPVEDTTWGAIKNNYR